jgi:hypothetical protein
VKGKADIDVCFVTELKDIPSKKKKKKKDEIPEEPSQEEETPEEKKQNEKFHQQSFRKTFINHISNTIKKSKNKLYFIFHRFHGGSFSSFEC